MDDYEFSLRWKSHQNTIISSFDDFLKNGEFVDCTLAAEGKFIKAHKVILSACSPYFATLLSQHYDKHPILILKDVTYQDLCGIMDYMYRGTVIASHDKLESLLKSAMSLQIKGIKVNCEEVIDDTPNSPSEAQNTHIEPDNSPQKPSNSAKEISVNIKKPENLPTPSGATQKCRRSKRRKVNDRENQNQNQHSNLNDDQQMPTTSSALFEVQSNDHNQNYNKEVEIYFIKQEEELIIEPNYSEIVCQIEHNYSRQECTYQAESEEPKYICDFCSREYNTKVSLIRHLKHECLENHNRILFHCSSCDYVTNRRYILTRHFNVHHNFPKIESYYTIKQI